MYQMGGRGRKRRPFIKSNFRRRKEMKEKKKSLPNEVTSKLWQKIKNDPELYEEKKRKRKIWFNKPEVAERRKAKLKEQYRKRKEENPEEYRRLIDGLEIVDMAV
jgi:hypothetical protein